MAIQTDGYQTKIAFTSASLSSAEEGLQFEIKELSPPGVSGGGSIDLTSMVNTTWRTFAAKSLKTLMPMSLVIAYDPELYDGMIAMCNDNQEIVITFPDSSFLTFWGYVDEFVPNAQVEGEQPTANVTIIPTNVDANADAEDGPYYTD